MGNSKSPHLCVGNYFLLLLEKGINLILVHFSGISSLLGTKPTITSPFGNQPVPQQSRAALGGFRWF